MTGQAGAVSKKLERCTAEPESTARRTLDDGDVMRAETTTVKHPVFLAAGTVIGGGIAREVRGEDGCTTMVTKTGLVADTCHASGAHGVKILLVKREVAFAKYTGGALVFAGSAT
jgi:hypothetical protein